MASDNSFVQAAIPCFDGHYDHWSMLMENFLRSKGKFWPWSDDNIEQKVQVDFDEEEGGKSQQPTPSQITSTVSPNSDANPDCEIEETKRRTQRNRRRHAWMSDFEACGGMGGTGKTTIAKVIYNKIGRNFEGRSFLANIREVWEQNVGQVSLQEQILFDICKETKAGIQNIDKGKSILKDKLGHKRVLLVLDDVNTLNQLNALCGGRQWFGLGSRIIITTRNMDLLKGNRVDKLYKMQEMNERESIELFSWHTFKQVKPKEVFIEISKNVVEYCGRLPLALEVLGSYLYGREVKEWECVLDKLKTIPNDQIHKKLKITSDGIQNLLLINYTKATIMLFKTEALAFFIE
ncbi:unnamed protein product [Vicia faba]|uniref:NB-ARC domain-containing protein n=1 Tax=Vicia faba TaxID=3906 RepID=A0AAV0ZBQ0_VICFA|nr:unnamed protein product [Vicia faba]